VPLKLNVGASRKVTDNNYGSRGAAVNLELELDSALIGEPARLQDKIRQLFGMVRTSLAEELNGGHGNSHGSPPAPSATAPPATAPPGNGSAGRPRNGGSRPATPAQVKALYAIARQQGLDLGAVLRERCRVERPEELTLRQASSLIDTLKGGGDQPGS
jgi:hypothetical protein